VDPVLYIRVFNVPVVIVFWVLQKYVVQILNELQQGKIIIPMCLLIMIEDSQKVIACKIALDISASIVCIDEYIADFSTFTPTKTEKIALDNFFSTR
jgi:hypothetical protein